VFLPITPLTPADIASDCIEGMGFQDLLANIQTMREELKSQIAELNHRVSHTISQSNPSL
jgi:hypothetical protein